MSNVISCILTYTAKELDSHENMTKVSKNKLGIDMKDAIL